MTKKRLILTNEQYERLIKEDGQQGLTLKANTPDDVKTVADTAKQMGINADKATIETPLGESKLIKLSDIKKNRLKILKENSEVYTVKDFMSKIIG